MPIEVSSLNVGVIGGGFMASVHSRAARAAGATLSRIASSTAQRGSEAADELGFRQASGSAEELIRDPAVDVVHVCTPNYTHHALARAAIDAGKHVVCEKPLAVDSVAAEELAGRASRAGVVATVPFVYRFHPMVREARSRIIGGSIGPVTGVHASYLQDWLLDDVDDNWRVDPTAGGRSRAFADIGSHLVDLVEFVTGDRIESLCAVTSTVHPTRAGRPVSTEDLAAVLVRLSGGAVGTVLVSQVAAGHKNDLRFEVFGATASIRFAQENPDLLEIAWRSELQSIARDAARLSPDAARLSTVPAGHPMGYQDAFNAFVKDTYAAIAGEPPAGLPTFADGARASAITDAVIDSAAVGRWIDVRRPATPPAATPWSAHAFRH